MPDRRDPAGPAGEPGGLRAPAGVDGESIEALASRYGHAAEQVLAVAAERPELAERIQPGLPDLVAEAAFAARYEQAATVGDVMLRRTRLGLLAGRAVSRPDAEGPVRVARALAPELGWDERQIERQLRDFEAEAAAEGIGL